MSENIKEATQIKDARDKVVSISPIDKGATLRATEKIFIVWAMVEGEKRTLSGPTMHIKCEDGETYFSVDGDAATWWPSGLNRELDGMEIMMIAWSNRRDTNGNLVPLGLDTGS